MTTPRSSKARGTRFERELAEYFRDIGIFPECERAPRWGSKDQGDLVNTGPFTVEAKATKAIDLAAFVTEAATENENTGREYPLVIIKRRNHTLDRAYAVMELHDMVRLIAAALDKEPF